MADLQGYTEAEAQFLLELARQSLKAAARRQSLALPEDREIPFALMQERACFVTLRVATTGELRGCTGTLAARNPLIHEVIITTRQTALNDPRFPAVADHEVPDLHIEISVLTPMKPLSYQDTTDLLNQLRPEIDGVTLKLNQRRATFLPDVWERVPDKVQFLNMLCEKMGVPAQTWQKKHLEVFTYQSIRIEE